MRPRTRITQVKLSFVLTSFALILLGFSLNNLSEKYGIYRHLDAVSTLGKVAFILLLTVILISLIENQAWKGFRHYWHCREIRKSVTKAQEFGGHEMLATTLGYVYDTDAKSKRNEDVRRVLSTK